MPTLVKVTGSTPAINIDVTQSSNTNLKTELRIFTRTAQGMREC